MDFKKDLQLLAYMVGVTRVVVISIKYQMLVGRIFGFVHVSFRLMVVAIEFLKFYSLYFFFFNLFINY